ncbi:MAG TPA: HAD family hydrolase [Dehalococcoidia bacterium]|jgi:putative hydrolase of the HAD superfamily
MHAVFFDLDDTLCRTSHTREPRARLAFDLLTGSGRNLEWDAFFASILEVDPATNFIRGLGPLLADLGIEATDVGTAALGLWFFDGCEHLISHYNCAADVLPTLADDFVLGVITNGPTTIQRRKFDALSCGQHFHPDLFITSEMAGCFKPDEAIFKLALARCGARPEDAVLIGDQPAIDVVGAQRAGMRGVWFNPEGQPLPDGVRPDATIANFSELPELLSSWRL